MTIDPVTFAAEWCAGWNARDLDRILSFFHEDVTFSSPVAASLFPESHGTLRGKAALRSYWEEGLRRIPDLHFTVEAVFSGVGSLVILYRNQKGVRVSEVLLFSAGLVREGHGNYPVDIAEPAGCNEG